LRRNGSDNNSPPVLARYPCMDGGFNPLILLISRPHEYGT
jgi:hypothetical protein